MNTGNDKFYKLVAFYITLSSFVQVIRLLKLLPGEYVYILVVLLSSYVSILFLVPLGFRSITGSIEPRYPLWLFLLFLLLVVYPSALSLEYISSNAISVISSLLRPVTFIASFAFFWTANIHDSYIIRLSRYALYAVAFQSLLILVFGGYPGIDFALCVPYFASVVFHPNIPGRTQKVFSVFSLLIITLSVKRLWIISVAPILLTSLLDRFRPLPYLRLSRHFLLFIPVISLMVSLLSLLFINDELSWKYRIFASTEIWDLIGSYLKFFLGMINPVGILLRESIQLDFTAAQAFLLSAFDSGRSDEFQSMYSILSHKSLFTQLFGSGFYSPVSIVPANTDAIVYDQSWVHSSLLSLYHQIGIAPTLTIYSLIIISIFASVVKSLRLRIMDVPSCVIVTYLLAGLFQFSFFDPLFASFYLVRVVKQAWYSDKSYV